MLIFVLLEVLEFQQWQDFSRAQNDGNIPWSPLTLASLRRCLEVESSAAPGSTERDRVTSNENKLIRTNWFNLSWWSHDYPWCINALFEFCWRSIVKLHNACGVEFLSKKRLNLLGSIFHWRNAGLSPACCSRSECLVLAAHFGASSTISAYHCTLNCRASWHASPDEGPTCDALNWTVSWDAHSLVGSVRCAFSCWKCCLSFGNSKAVQNTIFPHRLHI